MFKKTVKSQSVEPLKASKAKKEKVKEKEDVKIEDFNFSIGSKFLLDGVVYSVRRSYFDSNVEMRHIINEKGEEEVVMLTSLKKDAKNSKDFKVF